MMKRTLFLLGCLSTTWAYTLRQLHVITRHGARYPLVKDADTLEESTAGKLTTQGIQELKNLGTFLYETYRLQYNSDRVRFESSSFDRTLESALALSEGLYNRSVPVYTTKNENDITIRAYDKCPTFLEDLEILYDSEEWTEKERVYIWLLNLLADMPAFEEFATESNFVYLEDLWNVYDLIFVAKQQCQIDCPVSLKRAYESGLSEINWLQIQNLTHWAEIQKYKAGGKRLGANLLKQITSRMDSHSGQTYIYSGHYPTILGVLNALGKIDVVEDVVPKFSSAIIFEVYEENMMIFVKVQYKPDDGFTLKEISLCDGPCTLNEFEAFVHHQLQDLGDWCEACGNTEADVCLERTIDQLSKKEDNCPISEPLWMLAVGYVAALLCVGIVYAWLTFSRKRGKAERRPQTKVAPKEIELTESSLT